MVRHLERGRFLRVMITEPPQPRLSIKVPLVPAELRPNLLIADIPVRSAERPRSLPHHSADQARPGLRQH
jgi:hypothetical protein